MKGAILEILRDGTSEIVTKNGKRIPTTNNVENKVNYHMIRKVVSIFMNENLTMADIQGNKR